MLVNEKSLLSLPRQRSTARIIHRLIERPWLGSVRLLILIMEVHLGNLTERTGNVCKLNWWKLICPNVLLPTVKISFLFLSTAVCWTAAQTFNNWWGFIVCLSVAGYVLHNALNVVWICVCVNVCEREKEWEREREEVLSLRLLLSPLVLIMFFVDWTKEEKLNPSPLSPLTLLNLHDPIMPEVYSPIYSSQIFAF